MKKLDHILPAPKIKAAQQFFKRDSPLKILDIGCGNGSPSLFKNWYPNSLYHGLDIAKYNLSSTDLACMDSFIIVSPLESYKKHLSIKYDLIVLNHVIEHMNDSLERIQELCTFLNNGGVLYIAFPSIKSLSLPSAIGTLQFCDDPTHINVPCIREIVNLLLANGLKVIYAGKSRDNIRFLIGFILNIFQSIKRVFNIKINARGLWFYYEFESCIVGVKKGE